MPLLLKNCRLIRQKGVFDIYIAAGQIKKIGARLKAKKTINIGGQYILPGLIDSHVHFRTPGAEYKEDWRTGSQAAISGGVTMVLDMPNTSPPTTTLRELLRKKRLIQKKSFLNFDLHFGATNDNLASLKKVKKAASIKIYMGSSTGDLLVSREKKLKEIFKVSKKLITLHAEDEKIIQKNSQKYKNYHGWDIHFKIRTRKAAQEAVKLALKLAKKTKAKVYFCHISTQEEITLIKKAKKAGLKVFCEVTPHHLFLTQKVYRKQKHLVKVNPPLRLEADRRALWRAIEAGIVDTIATDHAPHTLPEKKRDYWQAPAGIPGLETMLPLLLNEVNRGKLSLEKLVELTSANPAKIFALKNKGQVKQGFDADLVVIDLNLKKKILAKNLKTKCGWSPWEGKTLKGWPVATIVKGKIYGL